MNENRQFQEEYKRGRGIAMTFGAFVYVGVVLAATTLFISFILLAFPNDAYFTRAIMALAGLLVGGSMLAFPIALHNWAVSGSHRKVAVGLYYGEMAIIALNTIVSFAALLYRFNGTDLPGWVSWYEPFSIGSIVYTLFAWGTVFLLDPQIEAKATEKAALDKFNLETSRMMKEYLSSDDGKIAIRSAANKKIAQNFMTKEDGPNPWIKTDENTQATQLPARQRSRQITADNSAGQYEPWTCLNCEHPNGDWGARFCAYCATERNPMPAGFSSNGKGKANP